MIPPQSEAESDVNEQFVYWDDLIRQIDAQMERIGWSVERGRQYLLNKYGVRSRLLLSDEQVFEFLDFLETQPTRQPAWKVGQECFDNEVKAVKENVQTTAENQDNFEGGLHIGLDQSETGLEGDFSAEKNDTPQSGAELDANEQSLSTNAQSGTKEDVLTVAKNLSLAGLLTSPTLYCFRERLTYCP